MYIDNTYELPCTEVVKSGTNRLNSGQRGTVGPNHYIP